MVRIIPNNDPVRLARILNDKERQIGYGAYALWWLSSHRDAGLTVWHWTPSSPKKRSTWQWKSNASGMECTKATTAHERCNSVYAKMLTQQVAMQHDVAETTNRARVTYQTAVATDNQLEATRQQMHHAQQARAEAAAAVQHMHAAMTSQLLTEDPSAAASTLGPTRIRPDHYKGMRPEHVRAVRAQQAEQVAAHEAARRAAQQQERAWAAYEQAVLLQRDAAAQQVGLAVAGGIQMCVTQPQAEAQRRASMLSLGCFLREQQVRDAERAAHLDRVYAPLVSGAYFSQFQTSHR